MDDQTPIGELMDRDPLSLSDSDIDAIVAQLRSQRAKYVSGNAMAGKPQKAKTKADLKREAAVKDSGIDELDLGDLGL